MYSQFFDKLCNHQRPKKLSCVQLVQECSQHEFSEVFIVVSKRLLKPKSIISFSVRVLVST